MDIVDRPQGGNSAVAALEQRVVDARGRLPLQQDPALLAALSDKELKANRRLAEWERRKGRGARRREVRRSLRRQTADARGVEQERDEKARDSRWHRRAVAGRKRLTDPDARLALLYRRFQLSSRALIGVVVIGMLWSGVNIQHNLVPTTDVLNPLFWLSYGVDALMSIPLIVIMLQATTASMFGREIERKWVLVFEIGLLLAMIGLNSGPQLVAHNRHLAAEYAVAPIMVAAIVWLHPWISNRYAQIINEVHIPGDDDTKQLTDNTARLLDLVVRVQQGLHTGEFVPSELNQPGEVAPSARAIAAKLNINKGVAGEVRDAINRLAKPQPAVRAVS